MLALNAPHLYIHDISALFNHFNPTRSNYILLGIATLEAFLFTRPRYNRMWAMPIAALGFIFNFYAGLFGLFSVLFFQLRRHGQPLKRSLTLSSIWIVISTVITYIDLPQWRPKILLFLAVTLGIALLSAGWIFFIQKHSTVRLKVFSSEERDKTRFASKEMAAQVIALYGNQCANCGAEGNAPGVALEMDHIIPYARGGPTTVSNLQPLCGPCNRAKSDMSMDEFLDWQKHHITESSHINPPPHKIK